MSGVLNMLEMTMALLLVAIFVVLVIAFTKGANSLCSGNCYQGRKCDCKDEK